MRSELDIPEKGAKSVGVPLLQYDLKRGGMRFIGLPPGTIDYSIMIADPVIDVNLGSVSHSVSWNSDKLVATDVPADSFGYYASGGALRVKVTNPLPGFLVEYDTKFWIEMISREIGREKILPDFLPFAFDPAAANLGRAGIQVLMTEASTNEPADMLALEAIGWGLLARAVNRFSGNGRPSERPSAGGLPRGRLDRVKEYVESHLADGLMLQELAEIASMSMSNFSRTFKLTTGLSPLRYVTLRRVERAKQMLGSTDIGIAQIAYACGFSGQSHLTRMFKEHVGTTPGMYRRSVA